MINAPEDQPNNDQSASHESQSNKTTCLLILNIVGLDEQITQSNPDGFFADLASNQAAVSVRVALRVRPLNAREVHENSKVCIQVNGNTVSIGNKGFTFDKAFDIDREQNDIFDACVKNLVLGCFAGFNATVLAYGQTGSGKTFTMGTELSIGISEQDLGIIPRVIRLIFEEEEKRRRQGAELTIKCSFLEIYNEELIDLLDQQLIEKMIPQKKEISIREEKNGSISVYGLNEVTVKSGKEMSDCLNTGSHARRTASTLMNQESSRSHGIFTVTIEQKMLTVFADQAVEDKAPEMTVAKFHFVDLAGSERAKKTGATGSQLREGIMINKSLLALGNVIQALTDENKKAHHVPYRDSKLTRILQDSLGGNSRTSMIACCSPAESSFAETLNTLQYASRARNIQNKPTVNRDPATQQIIELKQQVIMLQKEIFGQRKLLISNGITYASEISIPEDIESKQTNTNMIHQVVTLQRHQSQDSTRQLESIIGDLRKQLEQKESHISGLNLKLADLKQKSDQYQLVQLDNLKQRDEARLLCEQMSAKLTELGHPFFILEQQSSVLDEYRLKSLQLEMEIQNVRQQLQHLQIDNHQLIEQAERDTKSLEQKQVELEKHKRASLQWQSELEKVSRGAVRRNTVSELKSPQKFDLIKSQSEPPKWLSKELDYKIKHFEEIRQQFTDIFGAQVSNIMGGISPVKAQTSRHVDQKVIQFEEDDPSNVDSSSSDQSEDSVVKLDDDSQMTIQVDSPTKDHIEESKSEILSLDGQLKDKEMLLQSLKRSQTELQNSLLEAMKEEYHIKVEQLHRQLKVLETDKATDLNKASFLQKSRVEDQYQKRQQELQAQLQSLAKKDKDTKQLQKQLEEHQKKLKLLQSETEKLKTQRVIMLKKVKDDQEKLNKYKQDKLKEVQVLKQSLQKREKENSELKRNNLKINTVVKRRNEELSALQSRHKQDLAKKQGYREQQLSIKQIDLEAIRQWVLDNVHMMVQYQELVSERDAKDLELSQIEQDVNQLLQHLSHLQVQREREPDDKVAEQIEEVRERIEALDQRQCFIDQTQLSLVKRLVQIKPEPIDAKVMESIKSLDGARGCISVFFELLLESQLQTKAYQRDLELCESELAQKEQDLTIQRELMQKKDLFYEAGIKELKNDYLQRDKIWFAAVADKLSVDTTGIEDGDLQSLFRACFAKYNSVNQYSSETLKRPAIVKLQVTNQKNEQVNQTKMALSRQIAELEKRLSNTESINQKLQIEQQQAKRDNLKIKKKLDDEKAKSKKQSLLVTSTEDFTNNLSLSARQKDFANQLAISGHQNSMVESTVPSRNPRQLSLVKVERPSLAEIRNQRKGKKTTEDKEAEIEQQNQQLMSLTADAVTLTRMQLSATKDTSARKNIKSRPTSVRDFTDEIESENDKWQIMTDQHEAHKTQIYALANYDNQLYSGSAKSLKVWDLQQMREISSIHQDISIIKSIKVCQQRKLLIAASSSQIIMWDLVSLIKVGDYKCPNEVKCLQVVNGDYLFAGTKGSQNTGGLLIFDLRKSSLQPIDDKQEKNSDIFSITATDDFVYTGNRNHTVNPFSIQQWSTMPALQPPHYDAVSALTMLRKDVLVSGGKSDKSLRAYDVSSSQVRYLGAVNNAHTDQINCLVSDQISVFSGGKDGYIKVWRQDDIAGDLKCHASLDGNATRSSVNDLTLLDARFGQAVASAGMDKSIRIWQMNGAEDLGNNKIRDAIDRPMAPILTQGSALTTLQISNQSSKV